MNKYYYDLHIHSCLSPCGDNDMTPNNIAGMAALNGLNIVALTDHNTCKNCPAFFEACKKHGIVPVPGMELTTSEDIHMICLFDSLEKAMDFSGEVEKHRILIPNRADIFGDQLIMDGEDNVIGREENMLPNGTDLSVGDALKLAESFGGVCYPAHIDRRSNGIVSVLGAFPESPNFSCAEYHFGNMRNEYEERFPVLKAKSSVVCSDAHYLWDINEAENSVMIDDEPYSSALVRQRLIQGLKEGSL